MIKLLSQELDREKNRRKEVDTIFNKTKSDFEREMKRAKGLARTATELKSHEKHDYDVDLIPTRENGKQGKKKPAPKVQSHVKANMTAPTAFPLRKPVPKKKVSKREKPIEERLNPAVGAIIAKRADEIDLQEAQR